MLHGNDAASLEQHCKVDGKMLNRLMQALEPPKEEDLEAMHHVNENAAWFGITLYFISKIGGRM